MHELESKLKNYRNETNIELMISVKGFETNTVEQSFAGAVQRNLK